MWLSRLAVVSLLVVAIVAAWPQQSPLPEVGLAPVDHSQHTVLNHPADTPIPSLVARLYPDTMDGYNLVLETRSFRFTPQNLDGVIVANEGHAHLYLNGEKVARLYSPYHHLPAKWLREGINRLQVEFNANDHSIWGVQGEPIGADVLVDTNDQSGDPIVREDVRYTLDWDWGDAERHAGGGWTLVNDRGYYVHVTGGKLVTRSIELLPCHTMPPKPAAARLLDWLSPQSVYAGHSSLLPNESKITRSYEEDLADPKRMFLESRTVTDPEYCQAHYLIARPTGTGPGTVSLELSGSWSRTADGPKTPFEIESAAAYGKIKELPARRMIPGGIEIAVKRPLTSLLDSTNFDGADPSGQASRALRDLVEGTRVVVDGP